MKVLVFNTKGGSAKSLTAREIISAPIAKEITIIEVDALNETQLAYKDSFKDVIEINKNDTSALIKILLKEDNLVVDVGVGDLEDSFNKFVTQDLFSLFDKIVIPLSRGRTNGANAVKTYIAICNHVKDSGQIMFAFSRRDPNKKIEDQYRSFFTHAKKHIKHFSEKMYVEINDSEIFDEAEEEEKLISEIANDERDFRKEALEKLKAGDEEAFDDLIELEIIQKSASHLYNDIILPAHRKIMGK